MRVTTAFAAFFFAAALYSQTPEETPGGETSGENPDVFASIPVIAILDAAAGKSLDWRPGWPVFLPPDLFRAEGALMITTLSVPDGESKEVPDGETPEISAEWKEGILVRFPFFAENTLVQGEADYGPSGLSRVRLGSSLDAEILRSDDENRPVLVRILAGGEYIFSVLEYGPENVRETRYDAAGLPLGAVSFSPGEILSIHTGEENTEAELRRFFFNAQRLVSGLESPEGTWSILYERRGLPRYLAWKPAEGNPENYIFQWDENGRLIRLSGAGADLRYEYRLDDRGNWIERREIRMVNRAGLLFPFHGPVITRKIFYKEAEQTADAEDFDAAAETAGEMGEER
jgi:hypothetical protein